MATSTCLILLVFVFQALALWPAPQSIKTGNSTLWIESTITVSYNGRSVGSSLFSDQHTEQLLDSSSEAFSAAGVSSSIFIQQAVTRSFDLLFNKGLVPWKQHPRHQLSQFEPAATGPKICVRSLTINQKGLEHTFKPLAGQVDESYNLTISEDGRAAIDALSAFGILHALQTFIQLFYEHSTGGSYTTLAPVAITDFPKFPHRGLNMDVARNWYPLSSILHTIDALSWNKFNRLHIHMTDSQSWPMEIPSLPLLSQKGSYSAGLTYSPADIQKIHTYALLRGIEVFIEFDMPGHTTSIGLAYPELIAALEAKPWNEYCAEPPCGSLQLNNPAVPEFLEKLFDDVLPRVKPYTAYFHTGGDEVNMNTYTLDPTVQSKDKTVLQPLIQKFVDRNHDQIRKAGLTPVVWEEMLLEWDLKLDKDVVVQSWLSDDSVAAITKRGHKALAGNYNFWYLDCGAGQWLNFDNGPSFQQYYPFNDYCSPVKNWRLVYSYDPLSGVAENDRHLVLGGEVHMWSEQTDPVNLDQMVWPRAAAAGEILWSGRQDASGNNRSQVEASPRLSEWRERMVVRGIGAGPVQMVYCTQGSGTTCSL